MGRILAIAAPPKSCGGNRQGWPERAGCVSVADNAAGGISPLILLAQLGGFGKTGPPIKPHYQTSRSLFFLSKASVMTNRLCFLAMGFEDDILTSLAKVHDLRVISRTSVENYRGPPKSQCPRNRPGAGGGQCARGKCSAGKATVWRSMFS